MAKQQLPAAVSRFRTVALLRLARLETGWLSLPSSYDARLANTLVRDLQAQTQEARRLGVSDVVEVSDRLEKLLVAAELRRCVVPPEVDHLVTMAIQLLGLLIRGERTVTVDVPGFLRKMEDATHTLRVGGDPAPSSFGKQRGSS
jgi:hypothetical protein